MFDQSYRRPLPQGVQLEQLVEHAFRDGGYLAERSSILDTKYAVDFLVTKCLRLYVPMPRQITVQVTCKVNDTAKFLNFAKKAKQLQPNAARLYVEVKEENRQLHFQRFPIIATLDRILSDTDLQTENLFRVYIEGFFSRFQVIHSLSDFKRNVLPSSRHRPARGSSRRRSTGAEKTTSERTPAARQSSPRTSERRDPKPSTSSRGSPPRDGQRTEGTRPSRGGGRRPAKGRTESAAPTSSEAKREPSRSGSGGSHSAARPAAREPRNVVPSEPRKEDRSRARPTSNRSKSDRQASDEPRKKQPPRAPETSKREEPRTASKPTHPEPEWSSEEWGDWGESTTPAPSAPSPADRDRPSPRVGRKRPTPPPSRPTRDDDGFFDWEVEDIKARRAAARKAAGGSPAPAPASPSTEGSDYDFDLTGLGLAGEDLGNERAPTSATEAKPGQERKKKQKRKKKTSAPSRGDAADEAPEADASPRAEQGTRRTKPEESNDRLTGLLRFWHLNPEKRGQEYGIAHDSDGNEYYCHQRSFADRKNLTDFRTYVEKSSTGLPEVWVSVPVSFRPGRRRRPDGKLPALEVTVEEV